MVNDIHSLFVKLNLATVNGEVKALKIKDLEQLPYYAEQYHLANVSALATFLCEESGKSNSFFNFLTNALKYLTRTNDWENLLNAFTHPHHFHTGSILDELWASKLECCSLQKPFLGHHAETSKELIQLFQHQEQSPRNYKYLNEQRNYTLSTLVLYRLIDEVSSRKL